MGKGVPVCQEPGACDTNPQTSTFIQLARLAN